MSYEGFEAEGFEGLVREGVGGGEVDLVGPNELPQDLRRAWLSPCGLALCLLRKLCCTELAK